MTNVNILGKIKKVDEGTYIRVERQYKTNFGEYIFDDLPCIYWNRQKKNIFTSLKDDILVFVKGRLECIDEKMYIIVEEFIAF